MPSSLDDQGVFRRSVVDLQGFRHAYSYVEPVSPTAPPVVGIHGFGTSGFKTFRHVASHFLEEGIPLYALDLIGFGDSDAPPIVYSLDLYAKLVASFVETLHLENPIVLGHSMGGKIAVATAVDYVNLFSGLVLVNSGGFARTERLLPFIARSRWAQHLLSQDWFYFGVLPHTPFGPVLQTEENRTQLRMLRDSHGALDLKSSGFRARLHKSGLPTLIVWGAADRVLPRSTPLRIQRFVPHAHLRRISAAGHAPMKDQPAAFVQAVAPFVRQLS